MILSLEIAIFILGSYFHRLSASVRYCGCVGIAFIVVGFSVQACARESNDPAQEKGLESTFLISSQLYRLPNEELHISDAESDVIFCRTWGIGDALMRRDGVIMIWPIDRLVCLNALEDLKRQKTSCVISNLDKPFTSTILVVLVKGAVLMNLDHVECLNAKQNLDRGLATCVRYSSDPYNHVALLSSGGEVVATELDIIACMKLRDSQQ